MLANPGRAAFIVDEAVTVTEDEFGARTLGDLVRRGRHFGLEVHVLTQRVTDWFDSRIGRTIQSVAASKWFGQMEAREPNPVAVSRGPSLIDVFARGLDSVPYRAVWDGSQWHNWEPVGREPITFAPEVSQQGLNRLDLFACGTDGTLYSKAWDGSTWSGWSQPPPGPIAIISSPAAVSLGPNRIDVFAQFPDLTLNTMSWDGNAWTGWSQLGTEQIASAPAAASWGPNRIDVVARGTDNTLYTKSWDGTAWTGWSQLGTEQFVSDPCAVSWGPNRIDVFVLGTDDNVYTKSWDGNAWTGYTSLGQPVMNISYNEPWHNWAGNEPQLQGIVPFAHCRPTSLVELVEIVGEAEQEGRHVRGVGSGWSFSDIAWTPDYLVETSQLNSFLTDVLGQISCTFGRRWRRLRAY